MFHRFLTIAVVVSLVGLLVSGCGGGGGGSRDADDFVGEWEGTTTSSDVGIVVNLDLSLWMEGNDLQGIISNDAYNGVELDQVSVSGTRLSFRVPYTENQYVLLNGTLSGDKISGTYEDFAEDSRIDHGTWEVERDTELRVRSTEARPKAAHASGSARGFLGQQVN